MSNNFERMIALVNSFFDSRNDPNQLDVDEEVIARLKTIHPATMAEYNEGEGPIVWILLIPTTLQVMNDFIAEKISERELYNNTHAGNTYEAIYMCSASVLPEYRNKGLAKQTGLKAMQAILKDHPIKALYYWPFSHEGQILAHSAAKQLGLPLYERKAH
jgi:hypothetical protein